MIWVPSAGRYVQLQNEVLYLNLPLGVLLTSTFMNDSIFCFFFLMGGLCLPFSYHKDKDIRSAAQTPFHLIAGDRSCSGTCSLRRFHAVTATFYQPQKEQQHAIFTAKKHAVDKMQNLEKGLCKQGEIIQFTAKTES